MSEEIRDAVHILNVVIEGIKLSLKVGSGGLKALKGFASFAMGMLRHEKLSGKTEMKELLKRGGDMQVLRFKTKDMKMVEKYAKQYGILYSKIPNAGRNTGMSEIIFHTEAVTRANALLERLSSGKIINFDEYVKNKSENQVGKVFDFFKKKYGEQNITAETTKEHNNLANDIKATKLSKQSGLTDITIDMSLIEDANLSTVKARVPGTWGKDARYIILDREDMVSMNNGRTMLTFIKNDRNYGLFGKDGNFIKTISGNELLKNYDKVWDSVRKKAGTPAKDIMPDKIPVPKPIKTGR